MNVLFCLFLIINTIIWAIAVEYHTSELWDDADNNRDISARIVALQSRNGSEVYRKGQRPSRPEGVDSLANPRNLGTPDVTVAMQLNREQKAQETIQRDIRKRVIYFGILAVIAALLIWGFIRVSWGFKFGEPFYYWKELHDVLFLPV